MDNKQLKQQRIALFRDAAAFRKPERVPYFSAAVTWKITDAGYPISEAMTDYALMEKCVRSFLDKYPVDGLLDTGIRNQFRVTEAFGPGGYYYYNDRSVGIHDHAHCTVDTLMDYLNDPTRYTWEKILPEKYGESWAQKDLSVWKNTFREYMDYTKFIIHMGSVTGKEYGIPSLAPNNPMKGAIQFGIEELEANLLGIKQLSIALRRQPDKIEEFVRAWDEKHIDPIIEKLKKKPGANLKSCFDASIMMLSQNLLSPKQFERFYWPSLKRLLDAYLEAGQCVRVFTEGSILRFAEYFKDYPKGLLCFHLEQDDPFEVRRVLPNVCIMGGMSSELLSGGSAEDCVARAKLLCDELGKEGGFIMSENRMLSYANDAKSENLAAVCNFVRDYRP